MPIVFSAVVPHSPLLIPAIAKDNLSRVKQTLEAMKKIEAELYASQPDTIVVISPHGPIQSNCFTMNLNPKFTLKLEEFGDFTTKEEIAGDIGLAYKIRERMETRAPLQMISVENLDYGTAVPLLVLASKLENTKVIPLNYSGLDLSAHFKFGQLLKREFLVSKNRIAVIASAELSHKVTKAAPAGYSPKGKKFDQKLIEMINKNKVEDILNLSQNLISEICECGLKSIVMLLGALDGYQYRPRALSYEAPFGIGYLVMDFTI